MKRFIRKSGGVPDNELPTSNLERSEEAPAVPESLFNVGSWTLSVGRSFWPLGAALTNWPPPSEAPCRTLYSIFKYLPWAPHRAPVARDKTAYSLYYNAAWCVMSTTKYAYNKYFVHTWFRVAGLENGREKPLFSAA